MKYPIRSLLFLPLLRFGLKDEDWAVTILLTIIVAFVFMLFDVNTSIPLPLIGPLLAFAISVGIMRYLRNGKPPNWLQHNLQALMQGKTSKPPQIGTYQETWIK